MATATDALFRFGPPVLFKILHVDLGLGFQQEGECITVLRLQFVWVLTAG